MLAGLLVLACVDQEAQPGLPAPAFELRDLDSNTVRLSDFGGSVVVVDFWATWCAPCAQQIPVLNAFHDSSAGQSVVVLGISVDAGAEAVAPFAAEHHIAYPVLLGDESLAFDYGAIGFPALAVVDPQGRIDSLHLGVISRPTLEQAVAAAASRAP